MNPEQKELLYKALPSYLPYKLQCQVVDQGVTTISTLDAVYASGECCFHGLVESEHGFEDIKPILKPLSMITEEIEHNGERFVPYQKLNISKSSIENFIDDDIYIMQWVNYEQGEKLIEWHFDVFDLHSKNLCVYYE